MAKSTGVLHTTTEIADSIMIQERIYSYLDGFDAQRKNEGSGISKKGWTWVGTSHEDKKTVNGALWIIREVFIKTDRIAFINTEKLNKKTKK